jgi:hypothetical protein
MATPQRNPAHKPDHCPVCAERVRITPAHLEGTAPCPHCGASLSYVVRESEVYFHAMSRVHEPTFFSELAFDALEVGEHVRITNGAFEDFEGDVAELDRERKTIVVTVEIFDRPTQIELQAWQVERMSGS